MYDLLVIGGGPAGLGAAYRAAQRGLKVAVVERSGRVGGAAASFEVAGMPVDHGSHRLHPSIDPEILGVLSALLGGNLQKRRRNGRIRLAGRWIAFPLKPADLITRLPPQFAARAAFDAITSPLRRPSTENFAEALLAGVGPAIASSFYFPYSRKIWGIDPEQISAEQARRRISANSPAKLIARLLPGKRRSGRFFLYPAGGFGQICEALAQGAVDAGAHVKLNAQATAIRLTSAAVEVEHSGGESTRAALAFSTIPLGLLARLAATTDAAVLDAAASLEFRSMLLVYLVLETGRYTPYDAHYIPDGQSPVTRISEPKNYRAASDPSGRTVVCAEIPCSRSDEIWKWGAPRLGRLVRQALAENELPEAVVSQVEVRRLANAYPVYRTGYERAFDTLDSWAAGLPNLLTFGRLGLFAHDNTHHALAMAWAAVDAVKEDLTVDRPLWDEARRRFAGHVVED